MSSLDAFVFIIMAILATLAGYLFGRRRTPKNEVFLNPHSGIRLSQPDLQNLKGFTYDNIRKEIGLAVIETLIGHTFVPGRKIFSPDLKTGVKECRGGELIENYEVKNIEIVDENFALARLSYIQKGSEHDSNDRAIGGFEVLVVLVQRGGPYNQRDFLAACCGGPCPATIEA